MKKLLLIVMLGLAPLGPTSLLAGTHGGPLPITVDQLTAAKQAWCDGLLLIAKTHREGGDARKVAEQVLDSAYNYGAAPVLFKPTLAYGEHTFRTTRESALSYFVGGNPVYPEDSGFALKPWVSASFKIAATYVEGPIGITMGHVTLTDASGKQTTVEKTFVFRRGDDGKLRIALHKSSLPYSPKT